MRNFFCLFCLSWVVHQGFAQLKLVQFEQLDSLQKIEKRDVIVFIHTDWCKYCQVMKAKTFKNQEVVQLLNSNFYFIDFNAEEKRDIFLDNHIYKFKPHGSTSGIHELALLFGIKNGSISYPTLCVFNDKKEIIFQNNSYLNSKNLIAILKKLQ